MSYITSFLIAQQIRKKRMPAGVLHKGSKRVKGQVKMEANKNSESIASAGSSHADHQLCRGKKTRESYSVSAASQHFVALTSTEPIFTRKHFEFSPKWLMLVLVLCLRKQ